MMTQEEIRIALPKLFLWSDPQRFQEYPEAMARAEEGRRYTRLEIERELYDVIPTLKYKGGEPRGRRTDGIVNLYGLEHSGNRLRINGINLLKKVGRTAVPTLEGLVLGRQYRQKPDGKQWKVELAKQILLKEPRIRLLIGLMAKGASIELPYSGNYPKGRLSIGKPDDETITISPRKCDQFNNLLTDHASLALGPFWQKEISKLGMVGSIIWEGVHGDQPSTNDLPTALKKALILLNYIDLFDVENDIWKLSEARLASIMGSEIADSFSINELMENEAQDEFKAFAIALRETCDAEEFVVVDRLANRFGEILGFPENERKNLLDRFVRRAMYSDVLKILDKHRGQPRMGRGLFGDLEARRVKFEFDYQID